MRVRDRDRERDRETEREREYSTRSGTQVYTSKWKRTETDHVEIIHQSGRGPKQIMLKLHFKVEEDRNRRGPKEEHFRNLK